MKAHEENSHDLKEIDKILASDEEIVPSSGFLQTAMDRVRKEASMPAPIPFPWVRAILAIPLVAGMLGYGIWQFVRIAMVASWRTMLSAPAFAPGTQLSLEMVGWACLALAVSYVSWVCTKLLTRHSSFF